MIIDGWRNRAACDGADVEVFFPPATGGRRPDYTEARRICASCPVRDGCLADALATEHTALEHLSGMRGGLTPDERWALTHRRPA